MSGGQGHVTTLFQLLFFMTRLPASVSVDVAMGINIVLNKKNLPTLYWEAREKNRKNRLMKKTSNSWGD